MKKRTVIISNINYDDHTFFVANMGIEELSLFKKLKDNGVELKDEDKISDEEMLMLLRHCCTNGSIEAVYSIENPFNRDQKQINIIKTNIERKISAKGLQKVLHTDWQPSFSYDPGPINERNYLTILNENTERKQKELKELENIIKENTEKIKHQNWYIEQTKQKEIEYNKLKANFDILVERYKKGLDICKEQEQNARNNWPQNLKDLEININNAKKQLKEIENEIFESQNELNELRHELTYNKNRIQSQNDLIDQILQKYNL